MAQWSFWCFPGSLFTWVVWAGLQHQASNSIGIHFWWPLGWFIYTEIVSQPVLQCYLFIFSKKKFAHKSIQLNFCFKLLLVLYNLVLMFPYFANSEIIRFIPTKCFQLEYWHYLTLFANGLILLQILRVFYHILPDKRNTQLY